MFRKQLTQDLLDVFEMKYARLCGVDDESEVIYFQPTEIVSQPNSGSGFTHFRVYGNLGINQDAANGEYGFIHHKLLTSKAKNVARFQLQGDEQAFAQTLYDQHRIISTVPCVWEADIPWNEAPEIAGGTINEEVID